MKRVLVTGALGFIGRHLVRYLLKETDWQIVALDRMAEGSDGNGFLRGLPSDRVSFWFHDLKAQLPAPTGHFRYILHLAAQSHVDRSVKDPMGFLGDNVLGTANLLQYARNVDGLEKLLCFSTDETLGPCLGGAPFDEFDSLAPTNPYSASKAGAEMLCHAWASTYGLPIVMTRCTNVVGPGQDAEKFVPLCVERIKRDEMIQIHSRAGVPASRRYIDVEDVCAATLAVLLKSGTIRGRNTGIINIGSDTDWSNLDVVARLGELMQKTPRWQLVEDPPNRPRPDMSYSLNNQRLKDLGWSQKVSLESTLKRILACP